MPHRKIKGSKLLGKKFMRAFQKRGRKRSKFGSGFTMSSFGNHLLFPDRLMTKVRACVYNTIAFSGSAIGGNIINSMSPISVGGSQNASGLAWLISTPNNAGTALAPYTSMIVRKITIRSYYNTDIPSNRNISPVAIIYPLALGKSNDSLSITSAIEQPHASKMWYGTGNYSNTDHSKPCISYTFKPNNYLGISYDVYRSSSTNWATVPSPNPSNSIYLYCKLGISDTSVDSALQVNSFYEIDYHMEFFNKNEAVTAGPT